MRRRTAGRAVVAAVVAALASAVGACAALDQLSQYEACDDCDASTGAPGDAMTSPPRDGGGASSNEASATNADGGSSAGDARADATNGADGATSLDDAGGGEASDASALVDAGPGLDATADATTTADAAGASDGGRDVDAGGTVTYASDGGSGTCAFSVDASLLVYYPFENDTTDESGNANDGVATTGTDITYVAGKLGQGVTIDATGHGVAVSGTASLSGAKTLCAWLDPATGTTGQSLPVFTTPVTGGQNFFDIEAAGGVTAGSCSGLTANSPFIDDGACRTTTVAVTPGAWNLVCYAYGVGSTTFYANGASQTVPDNEYDPFALGKVTVGSNEIGGSTTRSLFAGQVDEVSIWSGWLPDAAVSAMYNGGAGCRLR